MGAKPITRAAGLRNVLVHHYVDVRIDLVAEAVGQLQALLPEHVRSAVR